MSNSVNLSNGVSYLAIPGPSVMPEAVLRAMHRASPNIYEGELHEITASVIEDLKYAAQTKGHVAMYICNGHGAWEAALSNMADAGDRILVAATGRFGHGWADQARSLGIEADVVDFGNAATIDLNKLEEALRADTAHAYRAVLVTHVDTSTSVRNDVAAVRRVMDAVGHPALLAVDCIASLGCDRFEMDAWGVDVMVAASQKGLMVPAGVGLLFMNDRAVEQRKSLKRVSSYWDALPRIAPEVFYQHFNGTAPTHHLYGFRAALDMIRAEGIENIWKRHEILANAVWAACDAWAAEGPLRLNIADPALRSHAVTAWRLGAPAGKDLRAWCETQAGLTLGIGLGMSTPDDPAGDGFLRFGHMGHVNAQMILSMLATTQTGMIALGIPHGSGALEAAGRVIANCA
jgi:alanine-glyoxylate transaminase/serine-glyoxylate transaminase/serine-pyruvate transaminase